MLSLGAKEPAQAAASWVLHRLDLLGLGHGLSLEPSQAVFYVVAARIVVAT